jgi:hypothetical protein
MGFVSQTTRLRDSSAVSVASEQWLREENELTPGFEGRVLHVNIGFCVTELAKLVPRL